MNAGEFSVYRRAKETALLNSSWQQDVDAVELIRMRCDQVSNRDLVTIGQRAVV
jgi:hypothetical protein